MESSCRTRLHGFVAAAGNPRGPLGFRSSFEDWCTGMYDGDDRWLLSEAALAHNLGNATEPPMAEAIC